MTITAMKVSMSKLKLNGLIALCSALLLGLCGCSFNPMASDKLNNSRYEERILFGRDLKLFSVRPDGSDEKLIDNDAVAYTVSPDGYWLLVFDLNSFKSSKLKIRIYDLIKGVVTSETFPDGTWVLNDSWWSDDGHKLMLYQATTASGETVKSLVSMDYYQAKLNKQVSYDVINGQIKFENISTGSTVKEFRERKRPPLNLELISPDHMYALKCEGKRYYWLDRRGHFDIYLDSLTTNEKTRIYKTEPYKFGNFMELSDLPWSPDSRRFVVSLYDRGFWSELFHEIANSVRTQESSSYNIYIIDRDTIKWKKLTDGDNPYWLKNFPVDFLKRTD